jgi:hypothetical protein
MIRPSALAPLALAAALLVAPARAGVTLSGEHKTLDGSIPAFNYTLSIDKDKVRMESSNNPGNSFIYRADKGVFWMVDANGKSYSEMSREDLEGLANTMDAALKQMQEQLAKLPPEQRKMMEDMMKENMPGAGSQAKTSYKKIGPGKVGSWSCEKYESYQEGKKKAEMCVVDPQLLGFSEADFKALKDLAKPFEKLAKDMGSMLPQDGVEGAPKGAPVKATVFEDGKAKSETLIKQVKKEVVSPALFEVPKGFAKKAMGMPGAGG